MAAIDIYATVSDLRAQFNIGDADDDVLLEDALRAASRSVDMFCGRRFWQDSAVQTRTYRCDDSIVAWVDDISTTTGLVIKTDTTGDYAWTTTWDSSDYDLEPRNASVFQSGDRTVSAQAWWRIVAIDDKVFPINERRATLQVTAKFGWSAVPEAVKRSTLIKAARLFKRKDAPFGALGFDAEGIRISRWDDPDVVLLLSPYQRLEMRAV